MRRAGRMWWGSSCTPRRQTTQTRPLVTFRRQARRGSFHASGVTVNGEALGRSGVLRWRGVRFTSLGSLLA